MFLSHHYQKLYWAIHLKLTILIDHNFWTNKDRAKRFSLKLTSDLGKIDGQRIDPSGALYVFDKKSSSKAWFSMKMTLENIKVTAVDRKSCNVIIL